MNNPKHAEWQSAEGPTAPEKPLKKPEDRAHRKVESSGDFHGCLAFSGQAEHVRFPPGERLAWLVRVANAKSGSNTFLPAAT